MGESTSELDFLTQQSCRLRPEPVRTTTLPTSCSARGQRTCHWANGKGAALEALLAAAVSHGTSESTSQQPFLFVGPLTNYVAEVVC